MSNDWGDGCVACSEVPRIARSVQDLYDTKEYFRRRFLSVCQELESVKEELKQLRKREETP